MPCALDIRKLRVPAHDHDPLTWRRQAENALGNVEVPSLSACPSAILCVRKLRHRLPGAAKFRQANASPSDLGATLDRLFHSAARPAHGFVPANAAAVVFANRAELLSCLALDWLQGDLPSQWWWLAMYPGLGSADAVCRAWLAEPRQVPAALEKLDRTGHSGLLLHALPTGFAGNLAARVAYEFALEETLHALEQAVVGNTRQRSDPHSETTPPQSVAPKLEQSISAISPPWNRWVKIDRSLSTESQVILIISAMLIRSPSVVRSSQFVSSVQKFTESKKVSDNQAPGLNGPTFRLAGNRDPLGPLGSTPTKQAIQKRADARETRVSIGTRPLSDSGISFGSE